MEAKAPKRKKTSRKLQNPFPGLSVHPFTNKVTLTRSYVGIFNGLGVTVSDLESITELYNNGFFGKGSLSRSTPQILYRNNKIPEILRQRQYDRRSNKIKLNEQDETQKIESEIDEASSSKTSEMSGKVIVLPDSEDEFSETENKLDEDHHFKKLPSYLKDDIGSIKETLLLTLEEAFFLTYAIGCLRIEDEAKKVLDLEEIWHLFNQTQNNFIYKYIVYHYFRSKGWVVKSGLKYGSDFLLYKEGPPFYHASYIVTIEVYHNFQKDGLQESISMSRNKISALTRLSITSGKEVLIAQVFFPDNFDNSLNRIHEVKINEVFLKRIFLDEIRKNVYKKK